MLTPSTPTDRASATADPCLPLFPPSPACPCSLARDSPESPRASRLDPTYLPSEMPFSGPRSALVLRPALRPPGRPARHWRAAAALLLRLPMICQAPWVPLGKGRAPATGRPFPFTPLPAGSQPARRPSEAVSPRAVPRQPPRASPRWPTCPQRRPGAGPRPGAGVASASGPAPPLAVPAPSWPACRARHLGPRAVPPASSFPALRPARPPTAAPPPWLAVSRG